MTRGEDRDEKGGGGGYGKSLALTVPTNPIVGGSTYGGNTATTNVVNNFNPNVVVNNPIPEPASVSVNKTLRKLNWLGAV